MISMDDIELLLMLNLILVSVAYIQCCIFLYISNALAMPSLIGKHGNMVTWQISQRQIHPTKYPNLAT